MLDELNQGLNVILGEYNENGNKAELRLIGHKQLNGDNIFAH